MEALAQEAAAEASARPQCAARPLLCAVHSGLRIDPSALRGILLELLANAFEYAGTGGAVTLEVRALEPGFAVLEILDGGPGIEAPSGDRLFRPFYRGQRDDERRTGIGLALVRAWTERAGGALRLVPTETPGRARLLLRLPAAA